MTYSLLTTKLFVPTPRQNLVPRPRLIEQLNTRLSRKLKLISAPAEFGVPGKVIHTPGNSQSLVSIVLDNGEVLVGDLFREESPGIFGLGMFYEHKDTSFDSIRKMIALDSRNRYLSHGATIDNLKLKDLLETHQ